MSETKLPVFQYKNHSRKSPNKIFNESRNFEGVKAGIPIAAHGRSFRDGAVMNNSDNSIEKNSGKLQKGDRSRIPVNNCLDQQHDNSTKGEHQIKLLKPSSKAGRKFGFLPSPNKVGKPEEEPPSVFVKETSDETSRTVERISKSALEEVESSSDKHQPIQKVEVRPDPFQTDEKLNETSNVDTESDQPLDQTYVKSQSSSELIDENSNETSKADAKTDRPLDQTYVKSGSLSELIEEAINQAAETDPSLNQTCIMSRRLSDLIEETIDQISESEESSSQTGMSSNERQFTFFTGDHDSKQCQSGDNVSNMSKEPLFSCYKIPEANELPSSTKPETHEPPVTAPHPEIEPKLAQPRNTVNSYSNTPTAAKILKQLENLSLKLYRNQEYLIKAIALKKNLLLTMASGQDLSPDDVQYQQVEELEEVVDTHTSEEPSDLDVQFEGNDYLYPVPWAGVRTVGFLFSLVGSNNVVSISPREAATTINLDVLISLYEDYLRRAESKKEMVETIKKLLLDGLEIVEDRMNSFRSFMDTWDDPQEGNATVSYYGERRRLLLEGRIHLRQTADDFNLLFGRMDQYTMERAGLLHVLKTFLRTQVDLFPEYKNLSSP